MAKFELTDDGTMDTVVRCTNCGEEMRFNFDPDGPDGIEEDKDAATAAYDAFVEECIETAEDEHDCQKEN
jgi:RNase P subunit RPR2